MIKSMVNLFWCANGRQQFKGPDECFWKFEWMDICYMVHSITPVLHSIQQIK